MNDLERRIEAACRKLTGAEAVLIGAGAGLSAAAGLDYSGPGFRKEFADYIERYGFGDLYTSSFYEFPTEEERWARWARHIDYIRFRPGAKPLYKALFDLVKGKEHFVITTNVDAQFRKAGFDAERIFEVQGDYGLMQCARGCHPKVYSDEEAVRRMLAETRNFAIPSALVPVCPVCGGHMDVHVRKNRFFVEDEAWGKAADRYEAFVREHVLSGAVVLMELGVGYNTPAIIRYPFEEMTYRNPAATLLRLNADEPGGSARTAPQTLAFTENMEEVIGRLKA